MTDNFKRIEGQIAELHVRAVRDQWSGHGEGGTIVKLQISSGGYDIYQEKPGEFEQAQKKAQQLNDTMTKLLAVARATDDIIADSQGVAGYHLSGDIAEWDEFDLPQTLTELKEGGE